MKLDTTQLVNGALTPNRAHKTKSGYLGALTYISGLVVLTADRTLALGPSEEQTHQLPFNQLSQNKHDNKSKFIILQILQYTGHFLSIPAIPCFLCTNYT